MTIKRNEITSNERVTELVLGKLMNVTVNEKATNTNAFVNI